MSNYSHSSLSAFYDCPKKYYYSYIERTDFRAKTEDTIELFLGKRVHECLEALYKELPTRTMTEQQLIDMFDQLWTKKWLPSIKIVNKSLPAQHYLELGCKCLSQYFRKHYPFNQHKILGTEQKIKFKLDDAGLYNMVGVIDRIDEVNPTTIEIHDYKTGRHLPTQKDCDKDEQLAAYAIGIKAMYPLVTEVILVWHYLQFDKELRSVRSVEALELLKLELIRQIEEINQAKQQNKFDTKRSRLCDWCEFKPKCPAFKKKL
jgi:putative RecB family exonuclease